MDRIDIDLKIILLFARSLSSDSLSPIFSDGCFKDRERGSSLDEQNDRGQSNRIIGVRRKIVFDNRHFPSLLQLRNERALAHNNFYLTVRQ